LFLRLFGGASASAFAAVDFKLVTLDDEDDREFAEVFEELEFDREWRVLGLDAAVLSGELGHELCGETGGVGGKGGRSAGVSFIT